MNLTSLTFCQINDHIVSTSKVIQCDTHLIWKDDKFNYAMVFFTDDNHRSNPHTIPTHQTKSSLLLITKICHEHVDNICNYKSMQKYRLPGLGFRYTIDGILYDELPVTSLSHFLSFVKQRILSEKHLQN
jgi:hypothetical protein